ncbi:MAG: hypothetical protein ABL899_03435, partial [Nitrospira sp.]
MPQPRVIEEDEDFPIKPGDIDATRHLWDAFGNQETEVSAGYIIRMMQQQGDWKPFTEEEIDAFYRFKATRARRFSFNNLIGEFWV